MQLFCCYDLSMLNTGEQVDVGHFTLGHLTDKFTKRMYSEREINLAT